MRVLARPVTHTLAHVHVGPSRVTHVLACLRARLRQHMSMLARRVAHVLARMHAVMLGEEGQEL